MAGRWIAEGLDGKIISSEELEGDDGSTMQVAPCPECGSDANLVMRPYMGGVISVHECTECDYAEERFWEDVTDA